MEPSGMASPRDAGLDLGAIGIGAGVLVGPVGIVLGALGLRRAATLDRRRHAIVAIVVGVAQTVVVIIAALGWSWAAGQAGAGSPHPGVPPEIVIDGQTVAPTYSPRPSPVFTPPPTATEEPPATLVPDTVRGGYEAGDVDPDPDADDAGAVASGSTTYTGPQGDIELRRSAWETPEDAAQYAETLGAQAAGSLQKTGTVGVPPDGEYWYYDDDGRSTMIWTQGVTVGYATGSAADLQMFYLEFVSAS